MRVIGLFSALLIAASACAHAADAGGGMGNMDMPGMDMSGGSTMPDAKHCAEMQAEQSKGTMPANMQSMLAACQTAAAPAPDATQDR